MEHQVTQKGKYFLHKMRHHRAHLKTNKLVIVDLPKSIHEFLSIYTENPLFGHIFSLYLGEYGGHSWLICQGEQTFSMSERGLRQYLISQ